jgi:hypothetical protein
VIKFDFDENQIKMFELLLQMVKFHCNAGHMMEGQPISTCTERELEAGKRVGHWSSEVPRCVKACTYPGSVIGGMIDDVRFYYGVGDKVCLLMTSVLPYFLKVRICAEIVPR